MIELKKLVEAGVHFGHHTSRWHPKMRTYIWGARNKTHLINVAKTAFLLDRAEKFLTDAAASGKDILWVGTKKPAQAIINDVATKLDMPYVSHRWIGGTLSNFDQVKKAVTRLLHLRDVQEKSGDRYTKKERSMVAKEIERLEKNVGGITNMTSLPAAIVAIDAKKERSVLKEANVMGIPVICLVDTNTDPSGVSYLVPGNDDSPKSIALIINRLADAASKGVEKAKAEQAKIAAEKKAAKVETAKAQETKKAAPAKEEKAPAEKAAEPAAKKPAAKKVAPVKAEAKEAKPKAAAAKKPATAKKPSASAQAPADKATAKTAKKAEAKSE